MKSSNSLHRPSPRLPHHPSPMSAGTTTADNGAELAADSELFHAGMVTSTTAQRQVPDIPRNSEDATLDAGFEVGSEATLIDTAALMRSTGSDKRPPNSRPLATPSDAASADSAPQLGAAADAATSAASTVRKDRGAAAADGYSGTALTVRAAPESAASSTAGFLGCCSSGGGSAPVALASAMPCLEARATNEVVTMGLTSSPAPCLAAQSAPVAAESEPRNVAEAEAAPSKAVSFGTGQALANAPHEALRTRADSVKSVPIGPPESVDPANIYKLYRGTTCQKDGVDVRIWVEFPALQLCWAGYDLPARLYDRLSLLDLTSCQCGKFTNDTGSSWTSVEIHAATSSAPRGEPMLSITGPLGALQDFAQALEQLLKAHKLEGKTGLEFIQKRLFQYLWQAQTSSRDEVDHLQAQAVLAFNLEPKEGVAYLRSKLDKHSEVEIGEWMAMMSSSQKGGLDPTLLGQYFSRRDTLEIFRAFVRCLDFRRIDIVVALRKLFDNFKPGGEGQVITRILDYFAEAYFDNWQSSKEELWAASKTDADARPAFGNPDTVMQVAVSLIMLNTGLHVAPKKVKKATFAIMTVEQYISNTRLVVGEQEVPDQLLRAWYDAIRDEEIQVEPMPRLFSFAKLPVQPDIEGWLIAVLDAQTQHRFWAVLALQRMYLFSDASDVDPGDVIDLKDVHVSSIADDVAFKDRFSSDMTRSQPSGRGIGHICHCFAARDSPSFNDLQDAEIRAFEVTQKTRETPGSKNCVEKPVLLQKLSKGRTRLALVAESEVLREKWVHLIASGPY